MTFKHNQIESISTDLNYKHEIDFKKLAYWSLLHIGAFYGLILTLTCQIHLFTFFYIVFNYTLGAVSLAVAKRLYVHAAFQTVVNYQLIVLYFHNRSSYKSVMLWAKDQLLHHKYNGTDADPFNASRGLFFAHIGWLCTKPHPLVDQKRKETQLLIDLTYNFYVSSQHDYYEHFFVLLAVIAPIYVPVRLWNETIVNAFFVAFLLRYVVGLHGAWLVQSVGHFYGSRPYDRKIRARNNEFVSWVTLGDGASNYYYSLPKALLGEGAEATYLGRLVRYMVEQKHALFKIQDGVVTWQEAVEKAKRDGDGTYVISCDLVKSQ